MFWDILVELCAEKGIYPNTLCVKLGLSNATATKWKKGSIPHYATLKKVANYFNVSVDYLLGRTNIRETEIKKPSPQIVKKTVYSYEGEDDLGTEEITFDLSKADTLNELIKSARTLSAEQINLLTQMAKNMKDKS